MEKAISTRVRKRKSEDVCTPPLNAFLRNTNDLGDLTALLYKEAITVEKKVNRLRGRFEAGKRIRPDLMQQKVDKFKETITFAMRWQAPMLVTFAEAYLQDILSLCASFDLSLMGDSKQVASYSEVVAARSIGELEDELRRRWARNFVDNGGPATWVSRLGKMGAGPFAEQTVDRLEELWGVRHVVIHRAGTISADFVRRHPRFGWKAGDRIPFDFFNTSAYGRAVHDFVYVTESYFKARFRSQMRGHLVPLPQ